MRVPVAIAALAIATIAHAEPLATSLPTEELRLANGLRVVLAPDPGVATVVVHAWYATGTDDGAAAMIAQLAFRGSRHLPDGDGAARIEAAGGWTNATAARDHTSVVALVPANALALALQLEAERMAGLADAFDATRVAAARAELQVAPSAREIAIDTALYPKRPDAHASTIAAQDLIAFARARYVPARTTIVIAGRFDPADARALVTRDFGWMPAQRIAVPPPPAVAPLATPVRATAPDDVPRLVLAFRTTEPLAPRFAVLATLLGGRNARLVHALVDAHLATDVRVDYAPAAGGGRFAIAIALAPGANRDDARAAVFAALDDLRTTGARPDELARATAILDMRFVESLENLAFRAEHLARFAAWGPAGAPLAPQLDAHRSAIRAVDAAAIRELVTTWLPESAAATVETPP